MFNNILKMLTLLYQKKLLCFLILVIATFLLVLFVRRSGGQNDQVIHDVRNVHYVDSTGSNFLFRGGLPQIEKMSTFNYQGLRNSILKAGKNVGLNIPSSFYLLDVNLLNIENREDANRIFVEYQFFKSNPQLGQLQVWGMVGTGVQATDQSLTGSREFLASNLDNWLCDKLILRVNALRQWLTDSPSLPGNFSSLPLVIYVHCEAGCDRTGELIGAYYLRFMNKSWEEMNALNQSMCNRNRPFHCKNYRATQWYCLWLNLEHGFSLNWQKNFSCSGK